MGPLAACAYFAKENPPKSEAAVAPIPILAVRAKKSRRERFLAPLLLLLVDITIPPSSPFTFDEPSGRRTSLSLDPRSWVLTASVRFPRPWSEPPTKGAP